MANSQRLRCKAGDLAIIRECAIPANVGKVVLVVERARDLKTNPAWIIQSHNALLVFPGDGGAAMRGTKCIAADCILTPIASGTPAKQRRTRKTVEV